MNVGLLGSGYLLQYNGPDWPIKQLAEYVGTGEYSSLAKLKDLDKHHSRKQSHIQACIRSASNRSRRLFKSVQDTPRFSLASTAKHPKNCLLPARPPLIDMVLATWQSLLLVVLVLALSKTISRPAIPICHISSFAFNRL